MTTRPRKFLNLVVRKRPFLGKMLEDATIFFDTDSRVVSIVPISKYANYIASESSELLRLAEECFGEDVKISLTDSLKEVLEREKCKPAKRDKRKVLKQEIDGPKRRNKKHPLVGLFFLTFNQDDNLAYQGEIIADLGNERFLAQYYECLLGTPSDQVIVTIADMVRWKFYGDIDTWHYYFEQYARAYREKEVRHG